MRILTKANEILSMKNLATNQAKREISQLYFGTHHEEADLEICKHSCKYGNKEKTTLSNSRTYLVI